MTHKIKKTPNSILAKMANKTDFVIKTKYCRGIMQDYYFPIDEKHDYGRHSVIFGVEKEDNSYTSISFTQSHKILIVGPTGAGKTFFARSLIDRCIKSDVFPVICTDLKPEFFSSVNPAKEKLQKHYLSNEKAEGIRMKVYYPKCFHKLIYGLDKYLDTIKEYDVEIQPIAISFKKMNLSIFLTLVNKEFGDLQRAALDDIFDRKDRKEILSYNELIKALENNEDFSKGTKKSIVILLKNLQNLEVVDSSCDFDITDDVNNGIVPVLALPGYSELGKNKFFASAFVALFVRNVMSAKQTGKIDKKQKLILFIDETPQFVPNEEVASSSASREEILNMVRLSRIYGVSAIFCTQDIESIPFATLGNQCSYIFLSKSLDAPEVKEIFVRYNLIEDYVPVNQRGKYITAIMREMQKYKDKSRDWLMIDKEDKSYQYFIPLNPLSEHLEEM